jgi:hypothetical protein
MPSCLFAAMEMPIPVPHRTTPFAEGWDWVDFGRTGAISEDELADVFGDVWVVDLSDERNLKIWTRSGVWQPTSTTSTALEEWKWVGVRKRLLQMLHQLRLEVESAMICADDDFCAHFYKRARI